MHSPKSEPHVTDIRNLGLAAAFECTLVAGRPGLAVMRVFEKALDEGLLVRFSADAIAVAPPFICTENDILAMAEELRRALRAVPTP
jgi:beta-alanine--pyruvate transaminase